MFVLIFSINNYNINLEQNLDTLFLKIIRPNDRLIVVSNNYYLRDRVVKNLEKEKEKLINILEVEIKRVRQDLQRMEFDLNTLVEDTVTMAAGGETVSSTNIEKFVNKIAEKDDVYYVLIYVPPAKSLKDKVKIKIKVNDQRYQVIYDDQQRPGVIKKMLKKNVREENPQIRINHLSYKNSDVLSKIEKAFLCKKEKFVLRVKPPLVSKGDHDIVVEVDDLLTGKNDVVIKEVIITGNK